MNILQNKSIRQQQPEKPHVTCIPGAKEGITQKTQEHLSSGFITHSGQYSCSQSPKHTYPTSALVRSRSLPNTSKIFWTASEWSFKTLGRHVLLSPCCEYPAHLSQWKLDTAVTVTANGMLKYIWGSLWYRQREWNKALPNSKTAPPFQWTGEHYCISIYHLYFKWGPQLYLTHSCI